MNFMKPNPIVGQTLYSLNIGNAARRTEQKLTPVVVLKVGRKYFTTAQEHHRDSPYTHTEYHLGTWREKTQYCENSKLYSTEQEYLDEKEGSELCRKISDSFQYGQNKRGLPLHDLRAISSLLP